MESGIAAAVDNPLITDLLDSVSYPIAVINDDGLVAYVNTAGCRLLSCTLDSVYHQPPMEALPALFGHEFHLRRVSGQFKQPVKYEEHTSESGRWFEIHACPSPLGLMMCARDITYRKINEQILTIQRDVLEMVAIGAPLDIVLRTICLMIERQSSEDLCSILLLSKDGQHLHLGAGGSLPAAYNAAIEGLKIGPSVGSCGTAAFTGQRVIVSDIASDPRWASYKEIALQYGLRACWSQPIMSREGGRVIGTIANYSRHAGEPDHQSLLLLQTAARLAQIALEQNEGKFVQNRQHCTAGI